MRAGAVACGLELARLRKEGKAYPVSDAMRGLLRGPMTEAWDRPTPVAETFQWRGTATPSARMMTDLSTYALWCGPLGPVHRQATLVFCLLVRSIPKPRGYDIFSRAFYPGRIIANVERLTLANGSPDQMRGLMGEADGLTVTDPIGALAMYAQVPLLPGWDGGGVGSVWSQAPDGFDAVIRAAMPDPPWLAELA